MKRLFAILCLMCLCIPLASCDNKTYYWEFSQESSQVEALYIVEAGGLYEYEIIKEIPIEKKKEVFDDIKEIAYKKYGTNLVTTRGWCFVIKYKNEDYDIISYIEPEKVVKTDESDTGWDSRISWYKCDRGELYDVIIKYLID